MVLHDPTQGFSVLLPGRDYDWLLITRPEYCEKLSLSGLNISCKVFFSRSNTEMRHLAHERLAPKYLQPFRVAVWIVRGNK